MAKENELEKRQKAWDKAFGEVKKAFGNVDISSLEDMALQITLSDEDCGGTLYAELKNGNLSVEPYDYKDNDAVLDVTKKALLSILQKKLSVKDAIDKGFLTVKGDLPKLANIESAIKEPAKRTVKRTTKKAAESKKEAAKPAEVKTEAAKPAAKKAVEKKAAEKKTTATAVKKTTAKKTTVKKATK